MIVHGAARGASNDSKTSRFDLVQHGPPLAASRPWTGLAIGAACAALSLVIVWLLQRDRPSVVASLSLLFSVAAVGATIVRQKRQEAKTKAPGLCLEGDTLTLHSPAGESHLLLRSGERFGTTVVIPRGGRRVVVALTSALGTFYIGATCSPEERQRHAALLARASETEHEDLALATVGPDGAPLTMSLADLARLVDELDGVDTQAARRIMLSGIRGEPIVLDGHDLVVEERRFDLAAPIQWRSMVFQEPFGEAVAVYQGTWVRQGVEEVVLVSLLSSIRSEFPVEDDPRPMLEKAPLRPRNVRFALATPDRAPPLSQRVAIDRAFVGPLRRALAGAPRISSETKVARA